MKISDAIRAELVLAVERAGGAKEFSRRCGIHAANISRYLRGIVRTVSDDNWEKLAPFLKRSEPWEVQHVPGTIANTPELRAFLFREMAKNGLSDSEDLRKLIRYDSPETIRRLLSGKLNWFPDVLSAVLDALGSSRASLPVTESEKELLAPAGIYCEGAMLVRPIPVVDWANAVSDLGEMLADGCVMHHWNTENTQTVPVPVGARRDLRAFRVHGVSMDPKIVDEDVLLVEPAGSLEEIPDNKIVVVKFFDRASQTDCVVCKRFHRQHGGELLLTSDNPEGKIIPLDPADVNWIGTVVRKISDL